MEETPEERKKRLHREAAARYRAAHKEKIAEYDRQYQKEHKDKIRRYNTAYMREYRRKKRLGNQF